MNALDWILLAILLLLGLRCLVRGFVQELLSVAAYAVGLGAALYLYKPAGALLASRFAGLPLPAVIAFAALFLVGFLLTRLLGKLLKEGLEAANLAWADKVLGFVIGLAEGFVVVALILLVLKVQPLFDVKPLLADSVFAKALLPIVEPGVAKALGGAANGVLPQKAAPKVPEALKKLAPPAPAGKP